MSDPTRPTTATRAERLTRLQALLQEMHWRKFEIMVPIILGRLIGTRLISARSGYQDGADAGTVGWSGRRLRIEAKRYSSDFDARDIVGGLRQAIRKDPSLECWLACSTRDIPEQLASQLEAEGASEGIPVMTIAWDDIHAPLLAALCTHAPAVVAEYAGDEAGRICDALAPEMSDALDFLSRELEQWRIGFDLLREATHSELQAMWESKRVAKARFGQDVAAGDGRSMVERDDVSRKLGEWWNGRSALDAPAAVVGQGGVGKTWASLGWIMSQRPVLPIVVTIPAGAVTAAIDSTVEGMLQLVGGRLAAITGTRDAAHWRARLKRILSRPPEEGPALLLLLDGLNQNDRPPWLGLLQLLQDRPFTGLVRTIVTTRPQHFAGQLGRTRSLVERADLVEVERFADVPGGELDQMLASHGLTRGDLHPDLVDHARVPRLFGLVVRLRERLNDAGRVTTHRLLWEYGRDAQGERAGSSFSEADWRAWLARVAENERSGLRTYTFASLGETAARPDLDTKQVAARLSDIVDGNLTVSGSGGVLQLKSEIVSHALGAALLDRLDEAARLGRTVEGELREWLDPIDGFEERAEVLRAATSIMAERDEPPAPEVAAAVVTAWLQTQNLPDLHLSEIRRLAPRQVQPLLESIERSDDGPQASARALAMDALREIDFEPVSYGLIVATAARWLSRVSRDVNPGRQEFEQMEAARSRRVVDRIGTDVSGPATVLGYDVTLVDHDDGALQSAAVTILDGSPLAGATEIFARAALAMSIRGRQGAWDDLKWLCLLNEVDPDDTASRVRALSAEIAERPPEPGVHAQLGARVAALLLWLTGREADDDHAYALDPGIDRQISYQDDYLSNPGASFFRLERRHAAAALVDRSIPLHRRLDRAWDYLLDPTFEVPGALAAELAQAASEFDVSQLDVDRSTTSADLALEQIEIALARCTPAKFAALHRRRLAGYADRPTSAFDSSAWSAAESILLADHAATTGCRSLRTRSVAAGGGLNASSATDLLLIEILDLPGAEQITAILDVGPRYVPQDFVEVLRPLSAEDVDSLIEANAGSDARRVSNLLCLLSATTVGRVSEEAWAWLEQRALDSSEEMRACAFAALRSLDAVRFGRTLLAQDWSWATDDQDLCRHHGSLAVAEAGLSHPFEEIAPRIAPALLPRILRDRGAPPAEAVLAGTILDELIMRPSLQSPEPGSTITVSSVRRADFPGSLSIIPGPMPGEEEDPLSALSQTPEARQDHSRRAVETALARIRQAHAEGANLYLSNIAPDDMQPIAAAAPALVQRWSEGAEAQSRDFRRRVHLAEGLYLALCEALLTIDPTTGSLLWKALWDASATRYVGRAGVDERILMLFRAPSQPETMRLRESLLDLADANTDEDLLNVAVAAIAHGGEAWLSEAIDRDARADEAWRRRRSVMLSGFRTGASLPVPEADLEGQDHSALDERRASAGRRLARDAAARHWWRAFVNAGDEAASFAAWTLFRRSADRRALAWLGDERWPDPAAGQLARRKHLQFVLNEDGLVRTAAKHEKDGPRRLFDRSVSSNVSPWYRSGGRR